MKYAIVDIETTGGNHKTGKITEVAIVLHNGHEVEHVWETLINPEVQIPWFITKLTGINNKLVANAPTYGQIANEIRDVLSDRIFVAHNVSFDYPYMKEEFKNVGIWYSSDRLCTIKSGRRFLPGHPSYGLGKLCDSLGIVIENRHRAAGDALATAKLFEMITAKAGKSLYNLVVQAEPPMNLDSNALAPNHQNIR